LADRGWGKAASFEPLEAGESAWAALYRERLLTLPESGRREAEAGSKAVL
jgi:hypothetical protein